MHHGAQPGYTGDAAAACHGRLTLRDLLGEAAWWRLSAPVRNRFAVSPARGAPWHFHGVMACVECSPLGRILAWVSRLTGAPIAHLTGRDVVTDVFVYQDATGDGTVWERVYGFRDHKVTARTTKRLFPGGGLQECFGPGLGMELDVFEHQRALHFRSTSFYADVAGYRIRLPHLLSPGTLLVEHIDEGGGSFRFRMSVDHRLFGRVFFQDGVFRKAGETTGKKSTGIRGGVPSTASEPNSARYS